VPETIYTAGEAEGDIDDAPRQWPQIAHLYGVQVEKQGALRKLALSEEMPKSADPRDNRHPSWMAS
jgi:hypothetical protein